MKHCSTRFWWINLARLEIANAELRWITVADRAKVIDLPRRSRVGSIDKSVYDFARKLHAQAKHHYSNSLTCTFPEPASITGGLEARDDREEDVVLRSGRLAIWSCACICGPVQC